MSKCSCKKEDSNPICTVYCSDGPFQGRTVSAVIKNHKIIIPMPTNPFYQAAVYLVTTTENIGIFSHCQKRITNEKD